MINVQRYIGIPFKENGRHEDGLDCYGLVRLIYKNEYNIELPMFDDQYFSALHDKKGVNDLIKWQTRNTWVKTTCDKAPNVVIFRLKGIPLHIGMLLEKSLFIHVLTGCNTCVENYMDPLWKSKIHGFFRYTNIS